MNVSLATLRQRAFRVPLERALAVADRFPQGCGARREQVECIVAHFLRGYETALKERDPTALAERLEEAPLAERGFAYEGAGMGLALVDALARTRDRKLIQFARGAGEAHIYMVFVGAGWAHARLPWLGSRARAALLAKEPLLGWLCIDGRGFHDGFFHAQRAIVEGRLPAALSRGHERRAFDQGLGRCRWFFHAADRSRIAATLARFDAQRRADLWSGVGLAGAYAGGETETVLESLFEAAGENRSHFAQGVGFAIEARARAGNPTGDSARVARRVWGLEERELIGIVDEAREMNLFAQSDVPRYESWRREVRRGFSEIPMEGERVEPAHVV